MKNKMLMMSSFFWGQRDTLAKALSSSGWDRPWNKKPLAAKVAQGRLGSEDEVPAM